MRILIFCNEYLPARHGVTSAVSNLARQATRLGHQMVVATQRHLAELTNTESIEGTEVWRFNWRLRPYATYPGRFVISLLTLLLRAREWSPDLLYQHYVSPDVIYPVLLSALTRTPLVVRAAGGDILEDFHTRLDQPFLVRLAFRRAAAIGFCSQYLMDVGAELVRATGKDASIMRDGVDVETVGSASMGEHAAPYMLNVGRFVYKKGQDRLILAYKRVLSEFPGAPDLWLCGDGEERSAVEQLAMSLGVLDRVRFLGSLSQGDVASLMRGCEFYVHAARVEPLGIVLLEAMAAGKAVVSPYVGGIPETVIPNITGILTAPTPESLSAGILQMLREPGRAGEMGRAARAHVKANFDWPDVVQDYLRVWSSVLESQKTSPK